MKNYYISLIIPAYNEERKIEKDIREAFDYFKVRQVLGQVIVSTDGITDDTNKIVHSLKNEFSDLVLLTKKERVGKGAAIKKGVAYATGKYIMFADAGLSVPFRFIEAGIKKLEQGFDLALGNRADQSAIIIRQRTFYRRVGSLIFSLLTKYVLGVPTFIKDAQCGFKIYKHAVAKRLFKELVVETMMFDLEIILRAKKYCFKIATFPIEWSSDPDTKFNPITGTIQNFKEIYHIKFKLKL